MKSIEAYKCPNGHVTEAADISFGVHFKVKCPKCDATVYKYGNMTTLSAQEAVLTAKTVQASARQTRKGAAAIAFMVLAIVGGAVAYSVLAKPKTPSTVDLAPLPTMAAPAESSEPPAVTPHSEPAVEKAEVTTPPAEISPLAGKRDILIADLNAIVSGEGKKQNVKINFRLVNRGDPATPYPDLRVSWPGSTARDVVIRADQYAHPDAPFSELTVNTELHKPPHATGINLHLN
ncbi:MULTISPECIES: hypothetical protein [Herbaspirillum]|uniref:hypothetical protein n=1 Tax=Herbaspirillum TaxID=963 RepID=UPI000C092237|nr:MULTISPECIES: hypothetical protein [Herbaspirillum]MAF04669.1 hypothetical protein [Herbaspirillum sp.]UWE19354.1 hypothetical protein NY669_26630 [Herbaspirillum huttiense]